MKIQPLPSRIPIIDTRTAKAPEKTVDSFYLTPEYRQWRARVINRAGNKCQDCGRSNTRLFADHIVEVKDDPSKRLDPSNGRARCGSCHTKKTNQERAKRHSL